MLSFQIHSCLKVQGPAASAVRFQCFPFFGIQTFPCNQCLLKKIAVLRETHLLEKLFQVKNVDLLSSFLLL